jgi:hypothetical protein
LKSNRSDFSECALTYNANHLDFDIAPGQVGTERKRADEASAVVELLRLADKALSINGELVNWIITAGIVGDKKAHVIDYIRLWHIGLGYLYWEL